MGGLALKFTSPGFTGVPDRIVLLPKGKTIFVELKKIGGKLSPRQIRVHQILRDKGFEVWTINNVNDFKKKLKEV